MVVLPLLGFLLVFIVLVIMYNRQFNSEKIPKIIHQTAPSDELKWNSVWFECQDSWKKLHPDFEYRMWTDENLDEFMKTEFPDFYENVFSKYDVKIKRIDSARYFILYKYGGIYADMDYKCQHRFFESLPNGKVSVAKSKVDFDGGFQNALMISPVGHPFWEDVFELLEERKDENNVILATGPRIISDCSKKQRINGLSTTMYNPYFDHWEDSSDNYPDAKTIHMHTYSWSNEDYKTVHVTKSYVITTNTKKGKDRIELLKRNFSRYKLPEIEIYYSVEHVDPNDKIFENGFGETLSKGQKGSAHSIIEVLKMIRDGPDEWCYLFEDDARVVNCELGQDLTTIRGVPLDADFIAVGRGSDEEVFNGTMKNIKTVNGGAYTHALLMSRKCAGNLIKAIIPIWYCIDVMIYKASCFFNEQNDEKGSELAAKFNRKNERLEPCVRIYCAQRIFDQTSNPTPPCRISEEDVTFQEKIMNKQAGYVIHPEDWVNETSSLSDEEPKKFLDINRKEYDSENIEKDEQDMVKKWIEKGDTVLEIGCSYGTVSCLLSKLCKKLVSLDPDKDSIEICKENMKRQNTQFECVWGTLSKKSLHFVKQNPTDYGYTNSYSSSNIPYFSIKELENKYAVKFNTLVVDCEGCMEQIFRDFDMSQFKKVIYERDNEERCNYRFIDYILKYNGLRKVDDLDRGDGIRNICWK